MPRHRTRPLWLLLLVACGPDPHWDDPIAGGAKPEAVVRAGEAAQAEARAGLEATSSKAILFGDLHVHSSYSWDGFLFTLPLAGGEGAHPPAEACDFARYCANLDFFALTDHAETLLPEHWEASKQSIRQCNALAGGGGSQDDPDLVAFLGFEWSQAGTRPEDHFGHRCVIFPGTADDALPARPISAGAKRAVHASLADLMRGVRWVQPWGWGLYSDYADYLDRLGARARCPDGVPSPELPPDCEETAPTPAELHEKLAQWGLETLEIPHGTAWGTYTPSGSDIRRHLDAAVYDPDRQRLIEVMSGHGNSEAYRPWRAVEIAADGTRSCPEPTPDFLPCCWRAGEIMRGRCGDLPAEECERRVALAREYAAQSFVRPQNVFPDAAPEEWLDCDQCRDCLKPAYGYRTRETVQYAMSLSEPEDDGGLRRFRYGFVASSDGHKGRPGTGYKQVDRALMADGVGAPPWLFQQISAWRRRMDDPQVPAEPSPRQVGILGSDMRVQSFLYPGGLAAVHADGRSRAAIWEALRRREVYGTSGPRILLWFDLVNAGDAPRPMGSEVRLAANPRFVARAVGSFEPQPGCPDWARAGLPAERLARVCHDECHHPSDVRRGIHAIEVVRIRPQVARDEAVGPLIEDPWRRFACGDDPAGCVVEFDDPEFLDSGRDALYYVRAVEVESLALNGDPLQTQFDEAGNAVSVRVCQGPGREDGCPAPVREQAWSSPIFVDQVRRPRTAPSG